MPGSRTLDRDQSIQPAHVGEQFEPPVGWEVREAHAVELGSWHQDET